MRRNWGNWGVGVAVSLAMLLFAPLANADTIQVNTQVDENSTGTDCSLREAIATANTDTNTGGCTRTPASGVDTITFDPTLPSGASIDLATLGTALAITTDMKIMGPGIGQLIVKNSASNNRIFSTSAANVEISGLNIETGKKAGTGFQQGGGILNTGNLVLKTVHMKGNDLDAADTNGVTAQGGAIFSDTGTLTLDHSVVDQSHATASESGSGGALAQGGAIYSNGTVTLTNSTIDDNHAVGTEVTGVDDAQARGGGIWAVTLNMDHSTVSNNTAAASSAASTSQVLGGGIFNTNTGSIELSTVAENTMDATTGSPQALGGGIYATGATLTLRSSTVAANGPLTGDNSSAQLQASATVKNTIIATPRGTLSGSCGSVQTSSGFNIDFSFISQQQNSCGFVMPTDQPGGSALGSLANNGGPTQTMLPSAGSGAIDKGSSVGTTDSTHDQRGFSRPDDFSTISNPGDGSDIGAVEVRIAPPTFTSTTPTSPNANDTPVVKGPAPVTDLPPTVRLYTDPLCTNQTGPVGGVAGAQFPTTGLTVSPVPHNATTTFYGTLTTNYGTSLCSSGGFPNTISYTQADPLVPPDVTPPSTTLGSVKINRSSRRAKFSFSSNEPGSTFLCKIDKKAFSSCTSPKKYKHLKLGKHKFRVAARDAAGNLDTSPAIKKFRI
jgi:CSLREA domain-containing protein